MRRGLFFTLAGWLCAGQMITAPARAADDGRQKHVLFLAPWQLTRPVFVEFASGLQGGFFSAMPGRVQILSEYVGAAGADGSGGVEQQLEWFRAKYPTEKFDLIIAAEMTSLRFALRARQTLWPNIPIVFTLERYDFSTAGRPPDSAGITVNWQPNQTAGLGLRLLPDTRHIAVIGGAGVLDQQANATLIKEITSLSPTLDIIKLTGFTFTQLRERMAKLPPQTIAMIGGFESDLNGQPIAHRDLIRLIEPVSSAPIFDTFDLGMGDGIVGGMLIHYQEIGKRAAELGSRILRGETPASIPVQDFVPQSVMFDARQLRRWNIPESRLPPHSDVLFAEPSVWNRYRPLIFGICAALLFQCLLIAALLVERARRRQSQKLLAERLEFEYLLAEISASLADAPEGIEANIRLALGRMAAFLRTDQALLRMYQTGEAGTPQLRQWDSNSDSDEPVLSAGDFPYCMAQWMAGKEVRFSKPDELPPEAAQDRESFIRLGVKSALNVPITQAQHARGVLAFRSCTRERSWPVPLVGRLRIVGEILLNAILQRDSQMAARASEALNRAVLSSLTGYVVIIDRDGDAIGANQGSIALAYGREAVPFLRVVPGQNYLAACREMALGDEEAAKLVNIVTEVLAGLRPRAHSEYRYSFDSGERWLDIHIERLDRPAGGAVITHLDVTARKRMELESAFHLHEIAHLNRVAALGEMAASLAHELNQPLTAILANGEAMEALMESPELDNLELRGAIADILEDGRRASEVIRNMRALLKKGGLQMATVDLNSVATETVRLVRNDAQLRKVKLTLNLNPNMPKVTADAVQLQQVILNLLTNGLDAMTQIAEGRRHLTVRTLVAPGQNNVLLEVEDSGPGVPSEFYQAVFQPFFTTKSEGLGVGLSISRSIIESFGGRIWAESGAEGGARFCFVLPPQADLRTAKAS